MIVRFGLLQKKSGMTQEEFSRFWLTKHGPLARRQQLDVANQLFTMGEHRAAADAYELFAEVYRNDTEEPNARVMLSLICVRYLKDADRGRKALEGVAARLREAQNRELAGQLQAELTAMATPAKL